MPCAAGASASIHFTEESFPRIEISVTPSVVSSRIILLLLWRPLRAQFDTKSRNLYTHLYLTLPYGETSLEFRIDICIGKTRMIRLPYAEENMTTC